MCVNVYRATIICAYDCMCIKYICANDMHKSGTRGVCDISSVLFYKTHTQVQQLQLASLIFLVFDCAIAGPCYLHSRLGPGTITGQINVCKHIFCSFTVRDPKAPVSAPKTKRIGITTAIDYCFELAVRELLGLMSHI